MANQKQASTFDDLVNLLISNKTFSTKTQAKEVLGDVFDSIITLTSEKESLYIKHFGKFSIVKTKTMIKHLPSGKKKEVRGKNKMKFRPLEFVDRKINGEKIIGGLDG
ncbi:MAG: HU family DNA-binding protein [Fusobacteriaceae bacterium]